MSTLKSLNVVFQEDLIIRGGAQLWLMNCGARLQAAGHQVTFVLPQTSLLLEDLHAIEGAKVETYCTTQMLLPKTPTPSRNASLLFSLQLMSA
jgi:hypothetical protein